MTTSLTRLACLYLKHKCNNVGKKVVVISLAKTTGKVFCEIVFHLCREPNSISVPVFNFYSISF